MTHSAFGGSNNYSSNAHFHYSMTLPWMYRQKEEPEECVARDCAKIQVYSVIWVIPGHDLWGKYFLFFPLVPSG